MRWLNAGETGDAAIKASATLETPPEHLHHTALISIRADQDHWRVRLPSHDFTLSTARQQTVVSRQVERNPLSRLLAHDPILTLTCILAPANDRERWK